MQRRSLDCLQYFQDAIILDGEPLVQLPMLPIMVGQNLSYIG